MELVGLEPTTSTVPPWRYYQLSYSPELVIDGHSNARQLTVSRRRQPQVHGRLTVDDFDWDQVAALVVPAVSGNCIDFICAIGREHVTPGR